MRALVCGAGCRCCGCCWSEVGDSSKVVGLLFSFDAGLISFNVYASVKISLGFSALGAGWFWIRVDGSSAIASLLSSYSVDVVVV